MHAKLRFLRDKENSRIDSVKCLVIKCVIFAYSMCECGALPRYNDIFCTLLAVALYEKKMLRKTCVRVSSRI